MKIVGWDLHARQQSIAMLDTESGEFTEKIIRHEDKADVVRDVEKVFLAKFAKINLHQDAL